MCSGPGADAHEPARLDRCFNRREIVELGALNQLHDESAWRHLRPQGGDGRAQIADEGGVHEVTWEDVDADGQLDALLMPAPPLAHGLLNDPPAHSQREGVGLDERQELLGADGPERRLVPTKQRLHPDDPPGNDVGLRLVVQLKLAALETASDLPHQLHPGVHPPLQPRVEDLVPVLAKLLGRVHRVVRVPEQAV